VEDGFHIGGFHQQGSTIKGGESRRRRFLGPYAVQHACPLLHVAIHGTPDEVATRIVELRRQVGPFGTLVYAGHDWADVTLSRRSMELMATEVMPRVNRLLGET
jgi:alkanesulfonate monooxygenase SsuD/methylene tetrahydromethanopterin reductase-like flavin-dependent oxidoreductase (luciferase family)